MATRTDFLKLILPGRGEYVDTWDEPFNEDMQKIEDFSASVNQELSEARKGLTTLGEFLDVSHFNDGSLKATPEVERARSSYVYGDKNDEGEDRSLSDHLELADKELWLGREGVVDLRSAMARRQVPFSNMILSGAKDDNGYPTWLSFSDMVATVRGDLEENIYMIDGKLCRTRASEDIDLDGSSNDTWYFLFAQFNEEGLIVIDGNSEDSPPDDPSGITSSDVNSDARIFTDTTYPDWTAQNVKAGDILKITSGLDKGSYIIKEVAPGGEVDKLEIVGKFPVGGISSLDYEIYDPLAVTLGFSAVKEEVEGRLYIGEVYIESGAITEARPYHFKDIFVGEWREVDVSGSPGTFEEIYDHNLGTDLVDVLVQASQADDGSAPVEQMCFTAIRGFTESSFGVDLNNALGVSVNNTLEFNQGNFNDNATGATHAADELNGDVTASISGTISATPTGEIQPSRSVLAKWDRKKIWIKNLVSQLFYRDYDGAEVQTGYIRVVISKRG